MAKRIEKLKVEGVDRYFNGLQVKLAIEEMIKKINELVESHNVRNKKAPHG